MDFEKQKTQRLQHADLSRKGSIDAALQDSVSLINSLPNYFTTSCCSGRIILFENECSKIQKKGCKWLHVTHDCVLLKDVEGALTDLSDEAVLKFEPMVMHVQCRSLEDAQKMHQAAVASGFRNSGITVGTKGKVMIAIRSTHSMEVPLSSKGEVLVSHKHLEHLVNSANSKMEENNLRIDRFYKSIQDLSKKDLNDKNKLQKSTVKAKKMKTKPSPAQTTQAGAPQKQIDDSELAESLSMFMIDNT